MNLLQPRKAAHFSSTGPYLHTFVVFALFNVSRETLQRSLRKIIYVRNFIDSAKKFKLETPK